MSWKGTIRSMGAAARRMEREQKRRQRELQRQQNALEKMQELERAAYEVKVYENHIDRLISVHKESHPPVRWDEMVSSPPSKPVYSSENEKHAQQILHNYQPGLIDKLFKRQERKRKSLSRKVEEAKKSDEATYQQADIEYEKEYADWKDRSEFATRILNGDIEAYIEAIKELDPFSELSELGSNVSFRANESEIVEADILVHGEDAIPKESKSLLQSGKLSIKTLPKGKFYELYQDYVCSCVLRVARELFSILPLKAVIVTAYDTLLNTQTGHLEELPILSVAIPQKTFHSLNLDMIDPSDSMRNFVHLMKFQKTKGFAAVERVDSSELQLEVMEMATR
jgi:hypothetical protein